MDFNRRNFLKGVSLAAFAGAAGGPGAVRAEGTTLVLPEIYALWRAAGAAYRDLWVCVI